MDAKLLIRRAAAARTVKSCGPVAPTLAINLLRRFRVAQVTVAKKPGAPRRARIN